VENSTYLKNIGELVKSLMDNLILFGANFINKHGLNITSKYKKDKDKFDLCLTLRDNVLYRAKSIRYHLLMLSNFEKSVTKQFMADQFDYKKRVDLMMYSVETQLFLLDDIVFHLISLFDYIGNLIGFTYYGEHRIKIKWKGIVKWCKNAPLEKKKTGKINVNNSLVSNLILKYQQSLVYRLEEYRACLFHYGKDTTRSQATINIMKPNESRVATEIPKDFQKWIKQFANVSEENEATLCHAAMWLVIESFTAANEIIMLLQKELKT